MHQGQFGEDYIRVLATAAGFTVNAYRPDVDGVDLAIACPGDTRVVRSPRIDVQVKTSSTLIPQCGVLPFDGLNGWQFNKLAGPDFLVPRYLFLVVVPPDATRYADLNHHGLLLRHIGYFHSLRSARTVPEQRTRVRVRVPTANVLTVESLRVLVEAVG